MKRFATLAAMVALALSLACKENPGPTPTPTATVPMPTPTDSPLPEIVPCHAIPPSPGIYTGDCQETDKCKAQGNGTYAGVCFTKTS